MKQLMVFALVFMPFLAFAQGYESNKYDAQGNLVATYNFTDSKNYDFITYHSNGKKSEEGTIRGGEKHGVWKSWNESGQLTARAKYNYGKRTGKWVIWDNGEKQVFRIGFENDNLVNATKLDDHKHVLAHR